MRSSALVLTALAFVASCGGASTAPAPIASGSASFSFTGGGDGTFSATGSVTDAATTRTYAVAVLHASDNSTNIQAVQATSASLTNILTITFKGQTPGTATITAGCASSSTVACNALIFDIGNAGGPSNNYQCFVTSGSITLATISGTTATGSFSGTGSCVSSAGVTTAFSVTAGSFTVPLGPPA